MVLYKVLVFTVLTLGIPAIGNTQSTPQLNTFQPLPELTVTTSPDSAGTAATPGVYKYKIPATVYKLPIPNLLRQRDILQKVSDGSQGFALDMLVRLSEAVTPVRRDFIASPFSVWSLLLPLTEGAAGNTLTEMRNVLRLRDDQRSLREAYRTVLSYLRLDTPTIKVASMQTLFTDVNQPVNHDFQAVVEREYGADIFPIDFHDPIKAATVINNEVRNATRNLIQHAVAPQDLEDAKLLLLSSLFFKGQWKSPFNVSMTRSEPFYNEEGKPIGNVEMMTQVGNFNYTGMNELEGHVLELPYGKEDRLAMLLILPKKGVSLTKVARNLQTIGVNAILEKLSADSSGYEEEEIEVYLPKFTTSSDFLLNRLLMDMGINDLFNSNADLSKIAEDIFVQHMIHSTKIIVDEEGTTAAGVTIAVLTNKATPPKFYLNRPFMYIIIEKHTNTILFYGHLMNPNNVRT